MNREKQIEEMAREMECARGSVENWHCRDTYCPDCTYKRCKNSYVAESLYDLGYRKQSENTIELPCKVGDMVYVPWRWGGQRAVATVRVEEIKFYDSQMHYMFLIDMESDNECFNQSFGGWKLDKSIGTTVFLTKEEAEAKMKGGAE